jgi:hypothetical protein
MSTFAVAACSVMKGTKGSRLPSSWYANVDSSPGVKGGGCSAALMLAETTPVKSNPAKDRAQMSDRRPKVLPTEARAGKIGLEQLMSFTFSLV